MRTSCLALILIVLAAVGCTPWANYPPIEGAVAINSPKLPPIPGLMASAIRWGQENDGVPIENEQVVFNLPPGTPAEVYDKVIEKLACGQPMQYPGERTYHITAIRVRASTAEVDLVHPDVHGVYGLTEIHFKQNVIHGWRIDNARSWRIRVDVPAPNYIAPPPPEVVAPEAEPMDEEAGS